MSEGSKQSLRNLSRSASRQSKRGERKVRSLQLIATGLRENCLNSAIHVIKQRTSKTMELVNLGVLTRGCTHFLVILPAKPNKEFFQQLESSKSSSDFFESVSSNLIQHLDAEDDENNSDNDLNFDEDFSLGDRVEEAEPESERYLKEVDIMKKLFLEAILPCLVKKRDEVLEILKENDCSSLEVDKERILLFLDGEFSNIEAIMRDCLDMPGFEKIEYLKHSAGCSLWQQMMDLMKGFWIWRKLMSVPPTEHIHFENMPPYAQVVYKTLKRHGMDKASIDLFLQNYFLRIPEVFDVAFAYSVMKTGWMLAGIYPYCMDTLLRACPVLHDLPTSIADQLYNAIKQGAIQAEITGAASDSEINALVGHRGFTTPIVDMNERCLNQQRALWLNKSAAIERRKALLARQQAQALAKAESKRIKESRKKASEKKKAEKVCKHKTCI